MMSAWPMLLDFTRDESRRELRRLELDAYASVMTAFRAQGNLDTDRRRILKELQAILSISTERHRAEVRRALNDERLYTIADTMGCGSNVTEKWAAEGRRLIPLLPRLVPQTAFTATATAAANTQADRNMSMTPPAKTGNRDREASLPVTASMQVPASSVTAASGHLAAPVSTASQLTGGVVSSAAGDVMMLPNGMSIHIKGGLSADDDSHHQRRQRRSSSTESLLLSRPATSRPPHPSHPPSPATAALQGITPLKISVAKSQQAKLGGQGAPQKVIIVSNTNTWATPAGMHKAHVAKAGTTTVGAGLGAGLGVSSVVTSAPQRPSSLLMPTAGGKVPTAHPAETMPSPSNYITYSATKLKPSTVSALQKGLPASRGAMVIPVGSQPSQQSFQNMHIKPVAKTPIHIKQEGSMKIITQGLPTSLSAASKLLPKPMIGSGCPFVMVTTAQPTAYATTKATAGAAPSSTKLLSLPAAAQQRMSSVSVKQTTPTNIVTVNPKKLHFATIKSGPGTTVLTGGGRLASGIKPNVIVVQKAGGGHTLKAGTLPTTIQLLKAPSGSGVTSAFEKELVSFIQKQDSHQKQLVVPQRGVLKHMAEAARKPLVKSALTSGATAGAGAGAVGGAGADAAPSASRSSLLNDLIQAAGIIPDVGGGTGVVPDRSALPDGAPVDGHGRAALGSEVAAADMTPTTPDVEKDGAGPSAVWMEFGEAVEEVILEDTAAGDTHATGQLLDSAAIKALLDIAHTSQTTSDSSKAHRPLDLNQLAAQLQSSQSQVYMLDENGQLVGEGEGLDRLPPGLTPRILQQYVQTLTGATNAHANDANAASVEKPAAVCSSGELDPQTGLLQAGPAEAVETIVPPEGGAGGEGVAGRQGPAGTLEGVGRSGLVSILVPPLPAAGVSAADTVTTTAAAAPAAPTIAPTPAAAPTIAPTPAAAPTIAPTPAAAPTIAPTPAAAPTIAPTPAVAPTIAPTPTAAPTIAPTPAAAPTIAPTPAVAPTIAPTPAVAPTIAPTPAAAPTIAPTPAAAPAAPTPAAAPAAPTPAVAPAAPTPAAAPVAPTPAAAPAVHTPAAAPTIAPTPAAAPAVPTPAAAPTPATTHISAATLAAAATPVPTPAVAPATPTASTAPTTVALVTPVASATTTPTPAPVVAPAAAPTPAVAPTPVASVPATPTPAPAPVVAVAPAPTPAVAPTPVASAPATPTPAPAPVVAAAPTPAVAPTPVASVPATPTPAPAPVVAAAPAPMPAVAPTPVASAPTNPAPVVAPAAAPAPTPAIAPVVSAPTTPATAPAPVAAPATVAAVAATSSKHDVPQSAGAVELPAVASRGSQQVAVDSVKQKLSFTPVPGSLRPAMTKTVSAPQVSALATATATVTMATAVKVTTTSSVSKLITVVQTTGSCPPPPSGVVGSCPPTPSGARTHVTVTTTSARPIATTAPQASGTRTVPGGTTTLLPVPAGTVPVPAGTTAVPDDVITAHGGAGTTVVPGGVLAAPSGTLTVPGGPLTTPGGAAVLPAAPHGRVNVTVQPETLDTTHMQMADFTSQQVDVESTEYSDSLTATTPALSACDNVPADVAIRLGKRKRKLAPIDAASTAWIKSALILLQKVARYRGSNKEKGQRNASAWFTRPVSPKVVPDYYQIIQQPMDFSTVKKKLELRRYVSWEEFHEDMQLIQKNCHQYNPPDSEVRADCDDVFAFYCEELDKAKARSTTETLPSALSSKSQKLGH